MTKAYESTKRSYIKLRNEFLSAYGGKCECCGETEPDFLTVDHVFGNGKKDRNKNGKYKIKSYEQLAAYRAAGWQGGRVD